MCRMAHTSGDTDRHLQRLAALVRQRRVALGFASKEAAADACGISHTTYRKVEGTETMAPQAVRTTTYAKLEIAFGMRAGACRAVLDGADSITLVDGTELIEGGRVRDHVKLQEEIGRAFDISAQMVDPDMTLSKSKAIREEMLRELRARGVLESE